MDDYRLASDEIDCWMDRSGPARRALLAPLAPLLEEPAPVPDNFELIIEPARWLLEQAGYGNLPLDRDGSLKAGFVGDANQELGFESPTFVEGNRMFVEIDALLETLRGLGSTKPVGPREILTPLGSAYLRNLPILWYVLAGSLGVGRPEGFMGEAWELTLAWLLQEELDIAPLTSALEEANKGHPTERQLETAFFCLYTQLRALSAFVPKGRGDPGKPRLRPSGKALTVEGLRAAVETRDL